jgi:hypothetical protein
MSSSPTGPSSTTGSSISSPSLADRPASQLAVIACGALAQSCAKVVRRRGWAVDVYPLPPLLHNAPSRIAGEVDRLAGELAGRYARIAVAYADCGTYGALDEVCRRRGIARLGGLHCYEVYAGSERIEAMFDAEPGTYVLTDFLVRSFARSVLVELGLDRHPELRDAYFGHYRRVVWLAQSPDAELRRLAEGAAARIGLPLEIVQTGLGGLERALEGLVVNTPPAGLI